MRACVQFDVFESDVRILDVGLDNGWDEDGCMHACMDGLGAGDGSDLSVEK